MLVSFLHRKRGKKNLKCMTGTVWSQPDMTMDSIAPFLFLFAYFLQLKFPGAQKKDAERCFLGTFAAASELKYIN